MSLFLVKHQHPADRCPAGDKHFAPMLLSHLASENAKKFGVTIQGEAVIDGQHTLFLIAEAADRSSVDRFMQPFYQAGSVEILPSSSCEAVVNRGTC
ncbi:MAG: DUF3303 domain-containing protein [Bacteroidota bacterium]